MILLDTRQGYPLDRHMYRNSHDALGDEPVAHVTLAPFTVRSVLGFPVVVFHKIKELVTSSGFGMNDPVLEKPLVNYTG